MADTKQAAAEVEAAAGASAAPAPAPDTATREGASPTDDAAARRDVAAAEDEAAEVEADERFSEHDSSFGGDRDSIASSTTSLQSAVTNYTFEHGRRFHAFHAGSYNFPNDDQEADRMDVEHINQLLQLDGKLHLSPLPRGATEVLDLGTGNGTWAIEMADLYPEITVYGTDLSPIQPSWVPPNCRFEIDDFNQDCVSITTVDLENIARTWGANRFDMIHCRLLIGSVASYPDLYRQAYRALKPGGFLEISDCETWLYSDDGTVTDDMAVNKWASLWDEAVEKVGKRIPKAEEYYEMVRDAGYTNIDFRIIKRPTNDWPKDPKMKAIGKWTHMNYTKGLEAFTLVLFTRVLGWKPEEVQILLAQIRSEWNKRRIHGWQKGIRIVAQKPLS